MKLPERIQNIKTLLGYCPKSSDEVKIIEDKVGKFFANLFNNDERFKHTKYDRVYPKISLSEMLNRDYKTYSYTINIEYVYNSDRDGDYVAWYYFKDDDLEDTVLNDGSGTLEYYEVPDYIWEIIQTTLYEKATKYIKKELVSSKKSVDYWENRLVEFNNNLKLNE